MQRKVNDVLDILVYLLQILEEADLDDDDSLVVSSNPTQTRCTRYNIM
jgi:hypothetical protein